MTRSRETLSRTDEAIARFDQALEAVWQIPRRDVDGVRVNAIEHGLMSLVERLRSLRDEVAGDGDRAGGRMRMLAVLAVSLSAS
jgi:hypothetical protein